jgi:hypothetical protein
MIKRKKLLEAETAVSVRRPPKPRAAQPCVGHIVGWSRATRQFVIDYPGNSEGPLRAQSTVQVTEDEVDRMAEAQQRVLLVFDGCDPKHPIVTGIVREAVVPNDHQQRSEDALVLSHDKRIEIRVGKVSLILTKDGKMIARAAYVSSRSSGAYRIRGGSVEIN